MSENNWNILFCLFEYCLKMTIFMHKHYLFFSPHRTSILKIFFHVSSIGLVIFLHIAISEFIPLQIDFILIFSWGEFVTFVC